MANIIVADDEKDVVELLKFLLEKEGHSVTGVYDGQACLDHVAMEKPDLILLDVMMPIMDGYTVLTRLAENDETRDVPILVLTAKGQMRDVFQMASNVADYMEKPFDPNALRERVGKILASRTR